MNIKGNNKKKFWVIFSIIFVVVLVLVFVFHPDAKSWLNTRWASLKAKFSKKNSDQETLLA